MASGHKPVSARASIAPSMKNSYSILLASQFLTVQFSGEYLSNEWIEWLVVAQVIFYLGVRRIIYVIAKGMLNGCFDIGVLTHGALASVPATIARAERVVPADQYIIRAITAESIRECITLFFQVVYHFMHLVLIVSDNSPRKPP